jgi:hypothetical protein
VYINCIPPDNLEEYFVIIIRDEDAIQSTFAPTLVDCAFLSESNLLIQSTRTLIPALLETWLKLD